MSEYKYEVGSTVPDTISGRIVGTLLGALVLALGLWIVRMGNDGRTPAEPIRPESVPGFILMGILFAWGGIQTIILSLGGSRLPRWVHALLLSIFLIVLGAPFVVIGIMDPAGISGSASLCGIPLYHSQGGLSGRIVFVGAGSIVLALVPFVWRWQLAKKR
jgi:hypothetical protein